MASSRTFRIPQSEQGRSYVHPVSKAGENIFVLSILKSGTYQIHTYDFAMDTTTQVTSGNGDSFVESISSDGRYILCLTFASNLAGSFSQPPQLLLRDRQAASGVFDVVSTDSGGNVANRPSIGGDIREEGDMYALFQSEATNLDGPTGGHQSRWTHRRPRSGVS
jgi:Tol biopolymer transport system component